MTNMDVEIRGGMRAGSSPSSSTSSEQERPRVLRESDWLRYRPRIKQLYIDQNLTLKEVMDIMRAEHSFFAS